MTADETTSVTFENVLKKFTLEVTKKDSEKAEKQGDASLAGAVYGVFKDSVLIDEYTTDENGYFKTKEYVCGNYTVQEISPSEGYLLDKTVYSVGAEAENYSIEHNPISMTVTEDVLKGKISIIKHSDDGTTQIETPEVGAEFEVYLKSPGSYEAAKDSEKDYLVCDENGYAATKMLPYGIYVVHQTWFCQYHLTHFIRTRIMQRERYDHSRAFFGLPEADHRWRCRFFCWPSNS